MAHYQQTISKSIEIEGIGLHSGKRVRMTLLPAPPFSGIFFVSAQKKKEIRLKASVHHITKTTLSTTLGIPDSAQVHTVEHILSALYGLGIDNMTIRLDDVEIPIMDGSALPFVKLISEGGIVKQSGKRSFLRILKSIEIEENEKSISIHPCPETRISYSIEFNHPMIGKQEYDLILTRKSFVREIAAARTFGFLNEFEELQKQGLIQGGSLENAVVIDQNNLLNKEGLRFRDEFVRHKILDLIGDFSLLGHPLQGHIIAHRAGHALHARLMAKILEEKEAWDLVETQSDRKIPEKPNLPSEALLIS
ncbi:MAG: UDP-3-O-acyl-N-acetylglucosamine deacetylase [Nitrospirae bacterium]|nr:UDP-3-O-acyl-N-acetylglucosamine deacetylase [Nitrospirota bacterium]